MDPVVILGSDVVAVGPGQEQRVPVRVRNQGRRVESYRIDVVGAPAAFAEVSPPLVSVLPGREAEVDVTFRPPGGTSTPTGSLPFAVRATSQVDASSSAVAEGHLELAGVAGMQAWARETTRAGRWSVRYELEFANQGNAGVRLAVTAHDPAGTTHLEVEPDTVDLAAGGHVTATVHARTNQPFLRGSVVNHTLQATCQTYAFGTPRPVPGAAAPADDPNARTFQLSFQQRPILPKFLIPLIALAVAALVAFAVVTLRKTTATTLSTTSPVTPDAVQATTGGPGSILLSWTAVPNAEGYEVRQLGPQGQPLSNGVDAKLAPTDLTFEATGLTPGTQFCLAVKALGPGGQDSGAREGCAQSGQLTSLAAPTNLVVTDQGGGHFDLKWDYDGPPSDTLTFDILVNGLSTGNTTSLHQAGITLPPEAQPRQVPVQVQAVQGEQRSPPSGEQKVTIAALPAGSTTAPPTTATTLPGTPTTLPSSSGATTTTSGVTTTTTPTPPAAGEIQDIAPTWAAMLGSAPSGSQGGVPLDDRKARLAKAFGVPLGQVAVFTNRDTVATTTDGKPAELSSKSASGRYLYAPATDPAAAQAICDRGSGLTCQVLHLSGAARASVGTPVLVLEPLSSGATLDEVDAKLDQLRTTYGRPTVFVTTAAQQPGLPAGRPVPFVSGFSTGADIDSLCAQQKIDPCTQDTFQAPG